VAAVYRAGVLAVPRDQAEARSLALSGAYGELMQNAKALIANYHSLVSVCLVVAVLYCR